MTRAIATEVLEKAQAALVASPIYLLRQIQVEQIEDVLILSGQVDTYYHKQLAQEVVRAVVHDIEVINAIDVQ